MVCTTGHTAPTAIGQPRLAFGTFFLFDLTLGQRACGQTKALGFAPPARPGEGKTPEDGCIFIEQDDLATTGPILQGGECERGRGEVSGGGMESPRGTAIPDVFFFTPHGRSRG